MCAFTSFFFINTANIGIHHTGSYHNNVTQFGGMEVGKGSRRIENDNGTMCIATDHNSCFMVA